MSLRLKTAPATEPITLTEAKLFLRVDASTEDDLITTMITAARQLAEEYTMRAFITQTWNLWLDHFPSNVRERWWDGVVTASEKILQAGQPIIAIPRPPLVSITHVKTYNIEGTASTFSSSSYTVDTYGQPGRVILNTGSVWPVSLRDNQAIDVEFVCGYGAASAVPAAIKHAIYIIIANMYECRTSSEIPAGALRLLQPYKVIEVGVMNQQRRGS